MATHPWSLGFCRVKRAPGGGWLAWSGLSMMQAADPQEEDQEPVYSAYGVTQDAAILSAQGKLEAEHGPRRWQITRLAG